MGLECLDGGVRGGTEGIGQQHPEPFLCSLLHTYKCRFLQAILNLPRGCDASKKTPMFFGLKNYKRCSEGRLDVSEQMMAEKDGKLCMLLPAYVTFGWL